MAVSMQDTRTHIYEIQYYLRIIQMANGETTLLNPDGIYDSETTAAVKRFQERYGLPVTGNVDNATWDKIYQEYKKAEEKFSVAREIRIYPVGVKEIKPGDEYDEIYVLQVLLKKNDERHTGSSAVKISGVFDKETENAVKEIQRIFGLPQTGVVNMPLWNMLAKYHNVKYLNE